MDRTGEVSISTRILPSEQKMTEMRVKFAVA